MAIDTELLGRYPATSLFQRQSLRVYVTDLTLCTQSRQSVTVSDLPQPDPSTGEPVDAFVIENPHRHEIHCAVFDDNSFLTPDGQTEPHCEGCFFLAHERWVAFLEIKDCKFRNIPQHKDRALQQLASSITRFRSEGIIGTQMIYGVMSFPRRKTAFNTTLFSDPMKSTRIKRDYGFVLMPCNKVFVDEVGEIKMVPDTQASH